ncbi:siderophore-interacting protein [Oligella ureolytica]|uniref:Siderophore-interacting protein n=2 Tax=Oligella ureolytica TaxID=90244 RepID=A0A7T3BUL3_9BURK|nr:siderophore-interacting protein [Oligella ureolytica]QPT40878.1 siderophore-interacting protein [Oligella ureolytica]
MSTTTMNNKAKLVERVRHPIKMRLLTVKRISELSPSMRRITLTGPDLPEFLSASFDDHIKLILPAVQGEKPNMPVVGEHGMQFDDSRPKPVMRDYTPRHYDPVTNELDIDFVLDHEGPATNWATNAEVGHYVGIGGPRGSFVIPTDFDWHLLIADETALPALSRRLEELPTTTRAIAIIKLRNQNLKIELKNNCPAEIYWVTEEEDAKDGQNALEATARRLNLPEGEGFVWAAGEYNDIKTLRSYLVDEAGINKDHIRASSYWRISVPDAHESFE